MDFRDTWGQWVGYTFDGTNNGAVMLNIDADRPNGAYITLADNNQSLSSIRAELSLNRSQTGITGTSIQVWPFKEEFKINTPSEIVPYSVEVVATFQEDYSLDVEWSTNVSNGRAKLFLHEDALPTKADREMNWDEFSKYVHSESRKNSELIYRGQQNNKWFLQTSFHRCFRRSLSRYYIEDLPKLNKYIAPQIQRTFLSKTDDEIMELVLLAQHHGFPTPYLDWSSSPFVASFFAFKDLDKFVNDRNLKTRIYKFDPVAWYQFGPKGGTAVLTDPRPTFTMLDIATASNNRVIPQQAVVTFSNLCNIENYIRHYERELNQKFLEVIDLRADERYIVMKDLTTMGITAATLFPGLDGTCETLRERYF